MNRGKVVIIGCGAVGTTIAYSMINQSMCEEIALIDINKEKAIGEALDMMHTIEFMKYKTNVKAGEYSDCKDADIVVITASVPMSKDEKDRMGMLEKNKDIMKSIIKAVMGSGFNGVILVVSNPVDVMTYYAYKYSGLPKNRVIGSGTTLDTARLHYYISTKTDVDPRSINAFVIGEHGDSEMIAWSTATIGGKDIANVFRDNQYIFGDTPYEEFIHKTVTGGWEVLKRKNNTSYGIAAAVTGILKAILYDENRIYPISVYLSGEYGEEGFAISVPTIINSTGAKEVVEYHLTDNEMELFKKSCRILKEKCNQFDL